MLRIFYTLIAFISFQPLAAGSLRDVVSTLEVQSVIDEQCNPSKFQLCVAAIFQNEARHLQEWIEYHKLLGVEHFYLYNNLSDDDYLLVLKDYIQNGQVDLVDWSYEGIDNSCYNEIQCEAYRDALKQCDCKWLAIIDIDEFLVPVEDSNLIDFLGRYESDPSLGGVVFPWVFFGTSHIEKIPEDKLMIETLILNGGPAAGGNPMAIWKQGAYKSIVRPKKVDKLVSPHYCKYYEGMHHIQLSFDVAQINHYWTRDEAFLHEVKIPRRIKWGQSPESVIAWAKGMNNDTIYGKRITKFIVPLRLIMGLPNAN